MDIEYEFNARKIQLKYYAPFKIQKIISNLPINSMDYIIDGNIVQRYDFQILDKLYDAIEETDIGNYQYNFPDMTQPTIQSKTAYLCINSNYTITCTLYGKECNHDSSKDYTFSQYREYKHITNNKFDKVFIKKDKSSFFIHCVEDINIKIMNGNNYVSYTSIPYKNDTVEIITEPGEELCIEVSDPVQLFIIYEYKNIIYVNDDIITQHITDHNFILGKDYKINMKSGTHYIDVLAPCQKSTLLLKDMYVKKKIVDKICPITSELLKENSYFFHCTNCENCFYIDIVYKWLSTNDTCPYCKCNSINKIIYKNCS
jgi:hypothetical protein